MQWLWNILLFIWNNLYWILPFGIFIFFFSLVAPITRTTRNIKQSAREVLSPTGFIVFVILMIIALSLIGFIGKLF